MAYENQVRQLTTLVQQILDSKTDGDKRESGDNEQANKLPPEATLDAWADSAAELKRNKVGTQKIEQTEALQVKIDTLNKTEE